MIEPALVPNVTLLALEKAKVEKLNEPLEADAFTGWVDCWVSPLWEAVIIDPPTPLSPKVTPLALSNKSVLAVVAVRVPAAIPMPPPAPGAATEAVTIPPADVPKVTLLALEKLSVLKVNEPAELETAGVLLATVAATDAVMIPPALVPKVTLFALLKLRVWKVKLPAELDAAWLDCDVR